MKMLLVKSLSAPLAIAVALLTGCATSTYEYPTNPSIPPVTEPQPVPAPEPETTAPTPQVSIPSVAAPNPAVVSLLKQARAQYSAQDYQAAIATAERGLRIDRRSADLYLLLAQSYVQLAMPEKARMFVQQGLRYAQQGSDAAQGLQRVQQIVNQ